MNMILKTGFTVALFAICILGISAMTAEPALAVPTCPANQCTPGEAENMYYFGTCALYVSGSYWGNCDVYNSALIGPGIACYCGCDY